MIGARTMPRGLSIFSALAAAAAIMVVSKPARAFDGPIRPGSRIVESADQTTHQVNVNALVSDDPYHSLLSHNAESGIERSPAMTVNLRLPAAWPGSVALPAPAGQNQPGVFGAPEGYSMLEQSTALESTVGAASPRVPDPGSPGQRQGKANIAPGTAPMTTGGKFNYFLRKSFVPPWPYALSVLGGIVSQAIDTKDKKHRENAGEFLTGSMEHAARSFAFRTTANFFEKFAYASLFKQDPRYHPSENKGFGSRLGYAISRVFVTRGDSGGSQFNASFILGGLTTAGISNAWEQDKHVNAQDTFKRWGTHVGLTALTNVLHELFRR